MRCAGFGVVDCGDWDGVVGGGGAGCVVRGGDGRVGRISMAL